MNTFYRISALALLLGASCFGQVALTQTTTTVAIDNVATNLTVASTTGITANISMICIYDVGSPWCEQASVKRVASSTQLTINRTNGTAHAVGAVVLIAPTANAFRSYNPRGTCTANQTGWTPFTNTNTGQQWLCGPYGWVAGWNNPGVNPQLAASTATASVAGATAIIAPLVEISGTNAITGFTMSVGWNGDPFCVIPTGAFTTTATNNIAIASTAVVGKTLCYTWDQRTSKFQPSY